MLNRTVVMWMSGSVLLHLILYAWMIWTAARTRSVEVYMSILWIDFPVVCLFSALETLGIRFEWPPKFDLIVFFILGSLCYALAGFVIGHVHTLVAKRLRARRLSGEPCMMEGDA